MGQYANKKPITAALEFEQYKRLKALSQQTRIPMQEYLREAVDMVLARHAATTPPMPAEGKQE